MNKDKSEKIFTLPFVLVFLAAGLIRISYQMQHTLMPLYMDAIGYSAVQIGLTTTVSTIASLILRPLLGGLLDLYGRRKIVLIGTGLFAVATACCGLPGGLAVILAMRGLQGIGFSMHTTSVNTIATDILPESRMSEGIGYMGLTSSVSSAIAPALALAFVSAAHYWLGLAAAGAAGLVALLCLLLLRTPDVRAVPHKGEKLNLLEKMWEKASVKPTLVMLVYAICISGCSTFFATYALQRGFESSQVSIYFTINAIATMAARLGGGKFSQKVGMRLTLILAAVMSAIGYLLIPYGPGVWGLWVAAGILGLSYGTVYPILMANAIVSARPERRGVAMATFLTGMDIGMGFGAGFWGLFIDNIGLETMFPIIAGALFALFLLSQFVLIPRRQA